MPRKKSHSRSAQGRHVECVVEAEGLSTSSLLADMQVHHKELMAEQSRLQQEIAAVAEAMSVLGGVSAPEGIKTAVVRASRARATAARRPAKRTSRPSKPASRRQAPSTGPSLKDYVIRVLGSSKKAMRVKDVERGVVKAGYKTAGKSLSNQVSMALADLAKAKKVQKVSHGVFRK